MDIWDSSKKIGRQQQHLEKTGINKIQNEICLSSALNVELTPPGTNALCLFPKSTYLAINPL